MTNKYNLDSQIDNLLEIIYPSRKKKVHGTYVNYPSPDVNLDDLNVVIDKIAQEMKERCIDIKTQACIKLVTNLTNWMNNNSEIITEVVRTRYNEMIAKANKWIEEHQPVEIIDESDDCKYVF